MKTSKLIVAVVVLSALSGCASMFNIGEAKLSGPQPQGFVCADTIAALNMTDNYQHGDDTDINLCNEKGKRIAVAGTSGKVSPFGNQVIPDMGPIDEPKPVLMPAQVMRVWVNAYEDASGSLQYPGRTFTEVTPRKWNVGYSAKQGIDSNRTFSPLLVRQQVTDSEQNATQAQEAEPEQAAEEATQTSDLNLNRMQQQQSSNAAQTMKEGSVQNPLPPLQ